MYFPIGWPKILRTPELSDENIIQVVCNRDKILFVVLTDDTISVWFTKVCLFNYLQLNLYYVINAIFFIFIFWYLFVISQLAYFSINVMYHYFQPCVLIVHHRRDQESLEKLGSNTIVEWKPDSTMLAVVVSILMPIYWSQLYRLFSKTVPYFFQTVGGHLILYDVSFSEELSRGGVYQQNDPPQVIFI